MNILQNLQATENNFAKKHWCIYLFFGFIAAGFAIAAMDYLLCSIGGTTLVKEAALVVVLAGLMVIIRTYFKIKG